jgi:hypothetical protein
VTHSEILHCSLYRKQTTRVSCVSTHFHLQTFLRKVPKQLLKAYFAGAGILQDFNWAVTQVAAARIACQGNGLRR